MNIEKLIEFFRSDKIIDLDESYKYEIMIACCEHSDYLEQVVKSAINLYRNYDVV